MPEFEERTEQATPRKKQKAREKGQVARSRELMSMSATGGILLVLYFTGGGLITSLSSLTGKLLDLRLGADPFASMRYAASEMLRILMPFFVASFILSVLAGVIQGGFFLKPLSIDMERLNPVKGLGRLFSLTGLTELLKGLIKFSIGGYIAYLLISEAMSSLPYLISMDLMAMQETAARIITKTVLSIFGTFFVLAVIDYLNERWKFERSHRMTKEEIKEEFKESEGNPQIKSRIKSLQREMARRRMMQEVPKATVVITNPTHIAVALLYKKDEMDAPQVIAKGAALLAEKIKEIATLHCIPIVEDRPLARALFKISLEGRIPAELYKAVAKILAHIYKMRGFA
jgi:flagellar biosynthetic protein FlhB